MPFNFYEIKIDIVLCSNSCNRAQHNNLFRNEINLSTLQHFQFLKMKKQYF